MQVGGAGNGGLNAESWEVWLPENRKPQSVVLTDDVTVIVLSTTGLVPMGGLLLEGIMFMITNKLFNG